MGVIFKNGIPYGGGNGGQCTDYTLDFNAATNELTLSDGSASVQTLGLDADTGWQTLTGEYFDVKYRKKNGVVYIQGNAETKKQIPAKIRTDLLTLPEGFRPTGVNAVSTFTTTNGDPSYAFGCFFATTAGAVAIISNDAIPANTWVNCSLSYPV